MCVCLCECVCECVCACVCACVCVCFLLLGVGGHCIKCACGLCACVRERESDGRAVVYGLLFGYLSVNKR